MREANMSGNIYLWVQSRCESYARLIEIWSFITINKAGQFRVRQSPTKEDYTKSIFCVRKKDKIYLFLYE